MASRSIVSQTGSLLSAVYQPNPAAGPRPFFSYNDATDALVPYARGVRQQVADGDLALGRDHRNVRTVPLGDRRLFETWNEAARRIVETDLAFLHQREDRDAGDRFRLGRNTEDRVRRHAPARFLVAPSDRALVDRLSVLQHERDRAADAALVDIFLERTVDAREPVRREGRLRGGLRDLAGRGDGAQYDHNREKCDFLHRDTCGRDGCHAGVPSSH